jgi:hypothetical protein
MPARISIMVVLLMVGALAGTGQESTTHPATAPQTTSRVEVTTNPKALLDQSMPIDRLMLHGVGLGDDGAQVDRAGTDERQLGDGSTWVRRRDGDGYVLRDGKVTRLLIAQPQLLERLQIPDERALLAKFGPPDDVGEVGKGVSRNYLYTRRGMVVQWSPNRKALTSISLGT